MPSRTSKEYSRMYYMVNREKILEKQRVYMEANREALRERARKWYKEHKPHRLSRARSNRLKRVYGLDSKEWDALFATQKNRCAVCETSNPGPHWHTDHKHDTGEVRGILCHNCNLAIGHARENPDILRKLIDYLTGTLRKGGE